MIRRRPQGHDIIGSAAASTATKHECLRNGVAGKPVGAIGATDRFPSREQARQTGLHLCVGYDATHMIVRDRRYLHRHFGQIDAIGGETVDHRPEGFAQSVFRAVLKTEIHPAVRRAAAGFDLLENRVSAEIS